MLPRWSRISTSGNIAHAQINRIRLIPNQDKFDRDSQFPDLLDRKHPEISQIYQNPIPLRIFDRITIIATTHRLYICVVKHIARFWRRPNLLVIEIVRICNRAKLNNIDFVCTLAYAGCLNPRLRVATLPLYAIRLKYGHIIPKGKRIDSMS